MSKSWGIKADISKLVFNKSKTQNYVINIAYEQVSTYHKNIGYHEYSSGFFEQQNRNRCYKWNCEFKEKGSSAVMVLRVMTSVWTSTRPCPLRISTRLQSLIMGNNCNLVDLTASTIPIDWQLLCQSYPVPFT